MKKLFTLVILSLLSTFYLKAAVPVVTSHPTDVILCDTVGTNLKTGFTITATGTLYYQWQVKKNFVNGWANVPLAAPYSGSTTSKLVIDPFNANLNKYQYRCVVIGTGGAADTSNAATLTVNTVLSFVKQSADTTFLHEGETWSLLVNSEGTNQVRHWYGSTGAGDVLLTNGGNYNGTTTGVLQLINVSTALPKGQTPPQGTYNYYKYVTTNGCRTMATNYKVLVITPGVTITSQPPDMSLCSGNTSFTVQVKALNPTYQWQVNTGSAWTNVINGGVYTNATTATLGITNPAASYHGYLYRCLITSPTDVDTTTAAKLSVGVQPYITGQPGDQGVCVGDSAKFSVAMAPGGATYEWQYSNNGSSWAKVVSDLYNSGINEATLKYRLAFAPQAPFLRCAITTPGCSTIYSNTVNFQLQGSAIKVHPVTEASPCVGDYTSVGTTVSGTAATLQWQYRPDTNSVPVNVTATAIYKYVNTEGMVIDKAPLSATGYYRLVITNTGCPNDTSEWGHVKVNSPAVFSVSPPAAAATCPSSSLVLTTAASPSNVRYEWRIKSGSNYILLTEGIGHTGVISPTLTITGGAPGTVNYYRCYASSPNCPTTIGTVSEVTVNSFVNSSVQILTTTNPICPDSSAKFIAAPAGGGAIPAYQWFVNGVSSGTNSATFKPATLKGGDKVKVTLTSSETCATPAKANSNTITMVQSPCLAPAFVSASNITATSVVASWASSDCAATYQVRYRPVGTTPWKTVTVNAGTLSKTITGLLSGTQYEMQARTRCNAAATVFSAWTPLQNFTTLVNCVKPTGITVTNIKKDRVTLNWGTVAAAYSYQIHYRVQGTTTWTTKIVLAPNTSRVLTGLAANTTYEYQLITICDASGKPKSAWTTIATVKTLLREGDMMNEALNFNVYPNPAGEWLTVNYTATPGAAVQVADVTGRVLMAQTAPGNFTTLNVSALPAGVYLVTVKSEHGACTKKFIKQ